MNIIRLAIGEQASYFADRVHVWQGVSGDHQWSGALATVDTAAFGSGKGLPSRAAAEAEGIAWAQEYAVGILYIQVGAQ